MNYVSTHAGDDSDGKIWGIEGMNILFILAGLLLSIGFMLLLSRHHAWMSSVGAGTLPFAVVTGYVFTLRQDKPRSFDTDLLETLATGTGWAPTAHQPHNPLCSHHAKP